MLNGNPMEMDYLNLYATAQQFNKTMKCIYILLIKYMYE